VCVGGGAAWHVPVRGGGKQGLRGQGPVGREGGCEQLAGSGNESRIEQRLCWLQHSACCIMHCANLWGQEVGACRHCESSPRCLCTCASVLPLPEHCAYLPPSFVCPPPHPPPPPHSTCCAPQSLKASLQTLSRGVHCESHEGLQHLWFWQGTQLPAPSRTDAGASIFKPSLYQLSAHQAAPPLPPACTRVPTTYIRLVISPAPSQCVHCSLQGMQPCAPGQHTQACFGLLAFYPSCCQQ
jgi:hypothetical protein